MTTVLLPGDCLPSTSKLNQSEEDRRRRILHLGPGLQSSQPPSTTATTSSLTPSIHSNDLKGKGREEEEESIIIVTKSGLLGFQDDSKNTKFWVESQSKRYIPHPPEPVLGVIIARHVDGYRVDIGSAQAASLDALAFEGATKRSKPNLKVGAIVYAHLLSTPDFSEPEIACVDAATQKSAGFGELTGGFLIRNIELGRCRALLSPKNPILTRLGASFPFEVAVGMNGRVWVKGAEGDEEKIIGLINELKG